MITYLLESSLTITIIIIVFRTPFMMHYMVIDAFLVCWFEVGEVAFIGQDLIMRICKKFNSSKID